MSANASAPSSSTGASSSFAAVDARFLIDPFRPSYLAVGRDGLARRGVLVRHLVTPGQEDEASAIFRWLAELSPDVYVNIMGQYGPDHLVGKPDRRAVAFR